MKCHYWDCPNRNELGYCKTTVCINPGHSQDLSWTSSTTNTDGKITYTIYNEGVYPIDSNEE